MLAILAAVILAQPAAQPPTFHERLTATANAVEPLVQSSTVKSFVYAVAGLPEVQPRTVYFQREPKAAFTPEEFEKLPKEQQAGIRKLDFDAAKYYDTFYGSPLSYARALDLCAAAGMVNFSSARILDYGYGGAGHLRALAMLGAEATGVDVDPILRVLYSGPGDQGVIPPHGRSGQPGKLWLVDGFWPGTPKVRADVGSRYDLFISKNTLKNGYVHPAEGVDPKRALSLGVTDDEFLKALAETINPGGLVMIYNLGPAPAPEGKPVIPWADIRCPFSKEQWAAAGFDIIAFDQDDRPEFVKHAKALGWDKSGMDLDGDLFVSYTLVKRKL